MNNSDNTTYYGHIDKIESVDQKFYFEFHCFEKEFADQILNLALNDFRNVVLENKDQVITLLITYEEIHAVYQYDKLLETESSWVIISTNKEKGLEAQLFIEGLDIIQYIYISKIEQFDPDDPQEKRLEEKVSLDKPDATEGDIVTLLERNKQHTPEFIAAYDVGQGNSNAICEANCMPLLYFDLGGGCYTNKHTYPKALNFCFKANPPILLSHWDTDHYQSAKLTSSYLSKDWIVPRQKIGPVHYKFFLSIIGKKLIWPPVLPSLTFSWGEICLCTGTAGKKNHTGLAFSAVLKSAMNTIKHVLLPADAAYTYIPCVNSSIYEGLIATHHGADFDVLNSPLPSASGKCAIGYSYGSKNTYGHPKSSAQTAHNSSAWSTMHCKETIAGNIALTDTSVPAYSGCGGICDLQIVQVF